MSVTSAATLALWPSPVSLQSFEGADTKFCYLKLLKECGGAAGWQIIKHANGFRLELSLNLSNGDLSVKSILM